MRDGRPARRFVDAITRSNPDLFRVWDERGLRWMQLPSGRVVSWTMEELAELAVELAGDEQVLASDPLRELAFRLIGERQMEEARTVGVMLRG